METMNLLVTLDENYIPPLRAMLKSLFCNNGGDEFNIYLIHGGIQEESLDGLDRYCGYHGAALHPIRVGDTFFADAPVSRYLTKAMYYRLLACRLLPEGLDKALYLDPDVLVLNRIRGLYETDLGSCLFGACIHTGLTGLADQVNKIRLNTYETEGYYNSGVLLMNLEEQRKYIHQADIYQYVADHKLELVLPDQDILNSLYGERIKPLDDSLYNYDAHRYETYRMVSAGEKDLDWVMRNTVILHYCGKNKPWIKPSRSRFGVLYKHYAALAERAREEIELCAGQTSAVQYQKGFLR